MSVHVCSSWGIPVPFPRLCDKGGKPPLLPPGASGAELWPARLASLTTELPKALLSLPVTLRVCWLLQPTHSTGALQNAPPITCFKCKEPVTASTPSAPRAAVGIAGALAQLGSLPRCPSVGGRRVTSLRLTLQLSQPSWTDPFPSSSRIWRDMAYPPLLAAPQDVGLQAEREGGEEPLSCIPV